MSIDFGTFGIVFSGVFFRLLEMKKEAHGAGFPVSDDCSVGFLLGGLGVFGIRFVFRIIVGNGLDHRLQTIRQHPGQAGRICNKILNSSTNDMLKYSFTAPTPENKRQRLCVRCIQLISVKESHGFGIRCYCKTNRARHICRRKGTENSIFREVFLHETSR